MKNREEIMSFMRDEMLKKLDDYIGKVKSGMTLHEIMSLVNMWLTRSHDFYLVGERERAISCANCAADWAKSFVERIKTEPERETVPPLVINVGKAGDE